MRRCPSSRRASVTDAGADQWISTNEADDVAGSLRHAIAVRRMVDADPLAWKWVALALHSALQGACVCHLTTTAAPVGSLTKKSTEEWLTFLNAAARSGLARPKTTLMALPDLLKAIRRARSAGDGSNAPGIAVSDAELTWLRRFHDTVRNQFVHFAPMGWSLEVSGIPGIGALAARIIAGIDEAGWGFRHMDADWRSALQSNLRHMSTWR